MFAATLGVAGRIDGGRLILLFTAGAVSSSVHELSSLSGTCLSPWDSAHSRVHSLQWRASASGGAGLGCCCLRFCDGMGFSAALAGSPAGLAGRTESWICVLSTPVWPDALSCTDEDGLITCVGLDGKPGGLLLQRLNAAAATCLSVPVTAGESWASRIFTRIACIYWPSLRCGPCLPGSWIHPKQQ